MPASDQVAPHRFFQAIEQTHEWLSAKADDLAGMPIEEKEDYFMQVLHEDAPLARAAQDFDFIVSLEDFPDSSKVVVADKLTDQIKKSQAPAEVRAIYREIYSQPICNVLGVEVEWNEE